MIAVVNVTMSFSENVVVTETSYQLLEVLSFCDREKAYSMLSSIRTLQFNIAIFFQGSKGIEGGVGGGGSEIFSTTKEGAPKKLNR